jgi:hypothetical protein
MKWMTLVCLAVIAACAGGPQLGYESAPDAVAQSDVADAGEAQALERAETDCARQGKHAVSQRVEGETIYDCTDSD